MDRIREFRVQTLTSGFNVSVLSRGDPAWAEFEAALVEDGIPVSLPNRVAWADAHPYQERLYFALRDAKGRPETGAAVLIQKSRAVPGFRVARTERVGGSRTDTGLRALFAALSQLHRFEPRILRLQVEVFRPGGRFLSACDHEMKVLGFSRSPFGRSYERTLVLPLQATAEELFAGIGRSARRNVRATDKSPVSLRVLDDPIYADRLGDLAAESHARTGSVPPGQDWDAVLRLSRENPGLSRVLGLANDEIEGPDGILSFAWGCCHGDHAHYAVSGSTRDVPFRLPLSYGPLWGLIVWAKEAGADYFDFGGTFGEEADPGGPLVGIDRFKRYFADQVESVAAEYMIEHNPLLGAASRFMGRAARLMGIPPRT